MRFWTGIFALALLAAPAHAQTLAETHHAWRVFTDGAGAARICYIVAEPQRKEPRNVRRGDVFMTITHRPAQGVHGEVSVSIGYPFSAKSNPFARVGGDSHQFFTGVQAASTADGWAWIKDTDASPRLIAAMKRGNQLVFKGTSARGTLTTDTYSLRGFTAAMRAMDGACS